ncbi:MAG: 2-oxo acid dehydrogenase subunit E2 [Caldilineae bacterium]|nr:MAG: 2-oxo acid dehydrogenase subunit E2 [Caldilineae bacterium]
MAREVIMPKFGFTQETATILRWLVRPGDAVEKGDPIAEVSTDKVDMEVEAPESGILDGIRYEAGATVPVTEVIAYIRRPNETLPAATPPASVVPSPARGPMQPSAGRRITPVAARLAQEQGVDLDRLVGTGPGGRITRRDVESYLAGQASTAGDRVRAAPAARRLARELGVSLTRIKGSGPRGRIQSVDVLAAAEASALPEGVAEVIPLQGMRRTIAERMQASVQQAPHIVFEADIDASGMERLRSRAASLQTDEQVRPSLTAIIVKACAWALRRVPRLNARLEEDNILVLSDIHIGVAVALEEGLVVPVVQHADQKGIYALSTEIAELAERARSGRLRPQDVANGTFTVSNLGMYGVDRFTAIINPPQAGILAVGRIQRRILPDEQDRPVARPVMTVTLSADHRVVDGAVAAQFLRDLRAALEAPALLAL